MAKQSKQPTPIGADTVQLTTNDATRPSPTRIEQAPKDEAAQRYADVIAQVRKRMRREHRAKS